MTINLLFGDEIRSHVLKILSGECVFERHSRFPRLYVLSPWISDVEIEFTDLYVSNEIRESKERDGNVSFLFEDYNIKSINLSYALLLFKLHGACEHYQHNSQVNIVTLPPDEKSYSRDYLPKVETLLDFLDEIGCNVLVNSKLHSKLLLANDLALLGSFNLSTAALYNREEIGVSINDLDNLERLENHCWKVIRESSPYGTTNLLNSYGDYNYPRPSQITRGWFLDFLVENVYRKRYGEGYGDFLDIVGGYDEAIKSYASDLNLFYLVSLRKLIASPEGKSFVVQHFRYKGDESTEAIMQFVKSQFARKAMPDIKLRIKSLR